MEKEMAASRISIRSKTLWFSLVLLFIVVMAITMYKDWRLTGEAPNFFFYLFVPPVSMLGGVLAVAGVAKAMKQTLAFWETAVIVLVVNIVMQIIAENLLKIVYYCVWEYPGILWMLFTYPFGLTLLWYGFTRWGRLKGGIAALLTLVELLGEIFAGVLFTSLTGLSTPGS